MGNPIFRFTLRHADGSLEITEPQGWMDAKLKLERHEDFHSLVEYFDGAFVFYGTNGVDNGGIDFIRYIEQLYGPDATLNIDIEVSFDSGVTYDFIFIGLLDLTTIDELKDNRAQIAIIRDDFWSKFIQRKSTPVNLRATTNIDDEPISLIDNVRLNLTSQKIRYNGQYNWLETVTYAGASGLFGLQLDWDETVIDDIKKFTLPRVAFDIGSTSGIALNLIGNFEAPWDGDYYLDIRIEAGEESVGTWGSTNMNMWVQDPTQSQETDFFTQTNVTFGGDTISVYTYQKSRYLRKGQQLTIFAHRTNATDDITIFGNLRLNWLADVDCASTGNLTLSGEQTIDGFATSTSRVLAKNQGDPEENGLWDTAAGAWTRATDADTAAELIEAAVFVINGSLNANSAWRQVETDITLNDSPVTWVYTTPSDERNAAYPGGSVDTHLIIQADTVYKNTVAQGFLIHDAAAAILNGYGLGVDNPFYSEYFGSQLTNARQYAADGCGWHYAVLKGLHLRGYTLENKQATMSLDQWWKGVDPIFNLGLGYDETATTPDQSLIRVEQKDFFYTREVSVNFDYVFEISRQYDEDVIFNKIENGYATWEAEEINGIDDPQTKHTYATRFKKIGKEIQIHSEFVAACAAIEGTRRQSIERSKDYKFDNNNFIISINPDDVSPDAYLPELDENFASISNLVSSDARYNLRLTPGRNFLRWINVFNGCLQAYVGSNFRFSHGEGNYEMISDLVSSCDVGGSLDEGANIPVTADFLHLPHLYTIEINLPWEDYKALRLQRHKAIGISQTDANHKLFFIKTLEYELVKGKCTIKAWPVEYFAITQTDFTPQMLVCVPDDDAACGGGSLDRITSDGEGRVTSDGECRIIA